MGKRALFAAMAASAVGVFIASRPAFAAPLYQLHDLSTLGGSETNATALNDNNQVVGESETSNSGTFHAFLWSNGVIHDLFTLNGNTTDSSRANSINNSGQITGISDTGAGLTFTRHAFLYTGTGPMTDIDNGGAASYSSGNSINNSLSGVNKIVYDDYFSGNAYQYGLDTTRSTIAAGTTVKINNHDQVIGSTGSNAFFYNGSLQTIDAFVNGGGSSAFDLNESGAVVGQADTASGHHPFLWDGSLHDLGYLGVSDGNGEALAINALGLIVGDSQVSGGNAHAFYYNGSMHDLSTLGGDTSIAWSVNNSGLIVGSADTLSSTAHAVLWDNGTIYDLNSFVPQNSNIVLTSAKSINANGSILALGYDQVGPKSYILTPVELPEPGSLGLVALGALGLLKRRKSPNYRPRTTL